MRIKYHLGRRYVEVPGGGSFDVTSSDDLPGGTMGGIYPLRFDMRAFVQAVEAMLGEFHLTASAVNVNPPPEPIRIEPGPATGYATVGVLPITITIKADVKAGNYIIEDRT